MYTTYDNPFGIIGTRMKNPYIALFDNNLRFRFELFPPTVKEGTYHYILDIATVKEPDLYFDTKTRT
jgi:hypothetical protein